MKQVEELVLGLCQVCEVNEAKEVRCSALGPVSIRYCPDCLVQMYEPRWMAEAVLKQVGGYEGLAEWAKPIIKASLERTGGKHDVHNN